jgi:hypothetical protein
LFAKRCFFQIGEFILHHFRQRNWPEISEKMLSFRLSKKPISF